MRVVCPSCLEKALIKSRTSFSAEVSDLYCQCTNVDCSHSFVMKLGFSHTISPSKSQADDKLLSLLEELPEQKRQQLAKQLASK